MTEAETTDPETDEQPEIEDDEMADVPDDLDALAEEVEQETRPDDVDALGDEATEPAPEESISGSDSWGDMYVGTLTSVSNAIIEQHGTEGAEPIEEDLARQLHLDEHFDRFMADRDRSEMPPEQAILIGTTMFLVVVIGTRTDLVSEALEEVSL